jgi:Rrf2 family protein
MRLDSRLSRVLHVLLHLAHQERPMTSETMAAMMHTNPVVMRRTLAGLREAGYVSSEKGHGGGWVLSRDLGEITLLDIYNALGKPELFAMGLSSDHPNCLVEAAVNRELSDSFAQAEALILARYATITLADLARGYEQGFRDHAAEYDDLVAG